MKFEIKHRITGVHFTYFAGSPRTWVDPADYAEVEITEVIYNGADILESLDKSTVIAMRRAFGDERV
jgi:hypothetical protein